MGGFLVVLVHAGVGGVDAGVGGADLLAEFALAFFDAVEAVLVLALGFLDGAEGAVEVVGVGFWGGLLWGWSWWGGSWWGDCRGWEGVGARGLGEGEGDDDADAGGDDASADGDDG